MTARDVAPEERAPYACEECKDRGYVREVEHFDEHYRDEPCTCAAGRARKRREAVAALKAWTPLWFTPSKVTP